MGGGLWALGKKNRQEYWGGFKENMKKGKAKTQS